MSSFQKDLETKKRVTEKNAKREIAIIQFRGVSLVVIPKRKGKRIGGRLFGVCKCGGGKKTNNRH